MHEYIEKGETLSQPTILKAVRNAIAVNEVNAQMGLICANPTSWKCGCCRGVLATITEEKNLTEAQQLDFLFTARRFWLSYRQ